MKADNKDHLKGTGLFMTGFLTEIALIQSMMRSKTLTVMVIVGVIFFRRLFLFFV
ncbi:hypothetical protein [Alishewanella longhuensis]